MKQTFKGELESWAFARHTGSCLMCDRATTLEIGDDGQIKLYVDSHEQCHEGRLLLDATTRDAGN
jgi:hypothetical protein